MATLVQWAQVIGVSNQNVVMAAPVTAGNLLVLGQWSVTNDTAFPPAGFTSRQQGVIGSSERAMGLADRVAQSGDGTTFAVGASDSNGRRVVIMEWSGLSAPANIVTGSLVNGDPTNIDPGIGTPIGLIAVDADFDGRRVNVVSPSTEVFAGAAQANGGPYGSIGYGALGSGLDLHADDAVITFHQNEYIVGNYPPAIDTAAGAGVWIDWDEDFFSNGAYDAIPDADVRSWTITRGVSGDLSGQSGSGSGIIILNDPDGRYNPHNAAGPLYGKLRDGPRVWIGINADGTIAYDAGKTVHGLAAGRITDITPIPAGGADDPPTVEIVFEDPLAWIGRTPVTVAADRSRSQYDLRLAILTAAGVTSVNLCVEPTTIPLSSVDGLAGNALEAINRANGTRHYAKPADTPAAWYTYTTVRRTTNLDGTSDASIDLGTDHATTSGWRTSADGVINQQRATIEPIEFTLGRPVVWEAPSVPFTLTGSRTFMLDFDDFVDGPTASVNHTGGTVTTALTAFGDSAKLVLTASGTATVTSVVVEGTLARRGLSERYVVNDTASQAVPRGVRAGSELTGDLLGIGVSADGMARHIVWRFASPLARPDLTTHNWFTEQFSLDLMDVIAVTSTQLSVTGRLLEIVGLTHRGNHAGANAIHHVAEYQLQECRIQTATSWFAWDVSVWDGAHLLAY
jgi:hypothetical protein